MHQWSTTPLNNQTADSRAQWQEGQPASSLNNSARGLMATVAFWRDDNLGILLATLGANNAYSVTTGQGLIDPASTAGGGTAKISHPFSLRVVLPAMNTAVATTAPTIAIDGAAAVPLKRRDGSALQDGDLTGVPVEILGDTVTSGAITRVRILDVLPSEIKALAPTPPLAVPTGSILPFMGAAVPTGYLLANGALVSRTAYADLFAFAQSSGAYAAESNWLYNGYSGCFTPGDGSTTFRIPALTGTFLRGVDAGRGIDPGRALGTYQADAFRAHSHPPSNSGSYITGYGAGLGGANVASGSYLQIDNSSTVGGAETRPINVAVNFILKY
jgi:microcystin-dependent protein